MRKVYHTRLDFIFDAIRESSDKARTVLDVGFVGDFSQTGFHYAIVDSLGEEDRLIGIDIDETEVRRFMESPETWSRIDRLNLSYEVMSVLDTAFADETFDVVLMLEVFEHLPRPYTVFDEVKRILKPGGSLIMTYPNPMGLTTLLKFILAKDLFDEDYIRDFKGNPQHLIFPHPVCLSIYLREHGFDVRQIGFLKYAFKRFAPFRKLLGRFFLTRRLSADVGFHAIKR